MRASTDTSTPQTFVDLRDKLAKNKALKLGDFNDREHASNLIALRKRLRTIGSALERKKNTTDPLNNPVRLFRSTASEYQAVSIDHYRKAVQKSTQEMKTRNDLQA